MKQLKGKYTIILMTIVIVVGIIMTIVFGFNKELQYQQTNSIDIYIDKEVDIEKAKEISNEVLERNNITQVVEIYRDMITIRAKEITEEQKNDIINKMKEIYGFDQKAEETKIKIISETKIRDMYKKYVIPFIISGILVLLYMAIRYYKKDMMKAISRAIYIPIIGELLLLSIIVITRIPIGRTTPVLIILMYILSILYVLRKNEK